MVAYLSFRFPFKSFLIDLNLGVFAFVAATPLLSASTRLTQLAAQALNVFNVALPLLAALGFFKRCCNKDIRLCCLRA